MCMFFTSPDLPVCSELPRSHHKTQRKLLELNSLLCLRQNLESAVTSRLCLCTSTRRHFTTPNSEGALKYISNGCCE